MHECPGAMWQVEPAILCFECHGPIELDDDVRIVPGRRSDLDALTRHRSCETRW